MFARKLTWYFFVVYIVYLSYLKAICYTAHAHGAQCYLRAYACSPGSAPVRPISVNPGLKFSVARFCILPSKVLLYLTRSKGSSVCCKLQLHARRQENFASNLV